MTDTAEKGARWFGLALLVIGALAVYGVWNKPEQTRPLSYDKGVYGGAPDSALDRATVDELRERASRMRNSGL
jgi:hypothetical protein